MGSEATYDAPAGTMRRALEELVGGGGELGGLLMTSFTFDPAFFEDNVLSTLVGHGGRRFTSWSALHEASVWADAHGLAVFHDARMLASAELRATFDVFPVCPERGVFHPKIACALVGEDVRVLVSSGNLSYSGWGQNREVWAIVGARDAGVAAPLAGMLARLLEACPGAARRIEPFLDALSPLTSTPATPESPRLVATHPGRERAGVEALTRALERADGAGALELTIASPYVRPGVAAYLSAALPGRRVCLAPARRVGASSVEMTQGDIDAFADATGYRFGEVAGRRDDRHDHLKVYQWSGGVMLGSHNATEAALGSARPGRPVDTVRSNWEASLLFTGSSTLLDVVAASAPVGVGDPSTLGLELGEDVLTDAWIHVEIDWASRAYRLDVLAEDVGRYELGHHELSLPGLEDIDLGALEWHASDETPLTRTANIVFTGRDDSVETSMLTRKWYELRQVVDEGVKGRRGIIHERHWKECRRSHELLSLDLILSAWQLDDLSDPVRAARVASWRGAELEHVEPSDAGAPSDDQDVFGNFFDLFRARRRFVERLARSEGEAVDAYRTRLMSRLYGSPDSLYAVVERAHERYAGEGWDAFGFTLTAELRRIFTQAWPPGGAGLTAQRDETNARLAEVEARWDGALERELEEMAADTTTRDAVAMLYERITGHAREEAGT